MTLVLETIGRNAACDAVVDMIDVGGGTACVKLCDSSWTVLAVLNLPNPSFGSSSVGTASANGLPISAGAIASGTIAYYQVFDRAGVMQWSGTVGTSGASMIVDSTSLASGQVITITAWTHSQPA